MLREFSLNVVSQGNSVKVTQSGLLKRQVKLLSSISLFKNTGLGV